MNDQQSLTLGIGSSAGLSDREAFVSSNTQLLTH
ncbi:hypothetical protein HDF11_004771 [Tunturiibacter psychrotolerans]